MKPEIICHIMSSVDGRLLPSRWTLPFDGTDPSKLFKEYAALGKSLETDAWMFGKTTAREAFPYKFMPKTASHPKAGKIHIGNRNSARLFITVDPDADIFYTSDRLRGDNIVTILGINATDDYLTFLEEKGISYIVLADPTALAEGMDILYERFNVRKISLQGGGVINGAMLAAGLIDELSLVIYPGIDGLAAAPSIFEYLGAADERPASGQSLELISVRTFDKVIVWLRYRFHKDDL
jgi:putative 5-amino-6-(5-phosphoribosylamino)uracil reductase